MKNNIMDMIIVIDNKKLIITIILYKIYYKNKIQKFQKNGNMNN